MNERILIPERFSTRNESELSKEQIRKYSFLIRKAHGAKAYPSQSGFFVKTSGMTEDGTVWTGGNKEFGHSDAIPHGEQAVVSGLRDMTTSKIEAIAWYRDAETGPDDFGRPCGKCRDYLKEYCNQELVLLNGNENAFVYTRLKDFLFEDFDGLNLDDLKINEVENAMLAVRGGVDTYLTDEKKPEMYGAVLVSESGEMWRGLHYSNVGYDAVTPLLTARTHWGGSYPVGQISEKHLKLKKVLVACQSGIPNVFYRDRQAILEFDETLRRYTGRSEPLRIELVHAKKDQKGNLIIYDARVTNTEEWLPHPFSPGAFRMDDVMEDQLQKLISKI